MPALSLDRVTKHHGASLVLAEASLTVPPRARIGVVGPNGIGKTTLLRLLAGLDEPDAGHVVRPPGLEVGYLPQETAPRPGETLRATIARRTGVAAAGEELEALAARLGCEPALADSYAQALDRFLALRGDDLAARAAAACSNVGLTPDALDRPLDSLSGGLAARASLAALRVARFHVLLLDEPTNDLDFAGLELLEELVATTPAAVVVVSHDREFLDRTVTRIVEIEDGTHRLTDYAGGWSEFEAARGRRRAAAAEAYGRYDEERARLEERLARHRSAARAGGRQANRRATHALATRVRAVERRLEWLPTVEKPWQPWRLELELAPERRAGETVVRLEGAVVERGDFRLGPVTLAVGRTDRLAVLGPNGSGKSTLLGALAGTLPLAAGRRTLGAGVRLGGLEQHRSAAGAAESLLDSFTRAAGLSDEEARRLLATFGLGSNDVVRPHTSLSPGERTRAALARLAATGANCLLLDEPTNHLDLPAIEELERALGEFAGAVVLVSHDRRFLDRFAATHVFDLGRCP